MMHDELRVLDLRSVDDAREEDGTSKVSVDKVDPSGEESGTFQAVCGWVIQIDRQSALRRVAGFFVLVFALIFLTKKWTMGREFLFNGTANGMGSTTVPYFPTEDLRTDEEKAELLVWADRFVARNRLRRERLYGDASDTPASPVDPPIAASPSVSHSPRMDSTIEPCLPTEDLRTDEEKAELFAWANRRVALNRLRLYGDANDTPASPVQIRETPIAGSNRAGFVPLEI